VTAEMKRIKSGSVTEALMSVMEDSDEIDQVLIIYRKKGSTVDKGNYAFHQNQELTLETSLFLVEMFKAWLFSCGAGDD